MARKKDIPLETRIQKKKQSKLLSAEMTVETVC